VINLADARGTESSYVMISRVKSLEGLAILTPFDKTKICCLRTTVLHGTEDEKRDAATKLATEFRVTPEKRAAESVTGTQFSKYSAT
jgi:hypothetical protein